MIAALIAGLRCRAVEGDNPVCRYHGLHFSTEGSASGHEVPGKHQNATLEVAAAVPRSSSGADMNARVVML